MTTAMPIPLPVFGTAPLVLRLKPVLELSEDQFFEFCQINRDLRLERTAEGELLVMAPAGFESGDRESEITMQLRHWAKRNGTGIAPSSATGYRLPNGAVRAPDASWVSHARLQAFSQEQRRKFLPLCPEFVLELRSPSDLLAVLAEKMREYMSQGALLGLLIDPETKQVHRYLPNQPAELIEQPDQVSCDPLLPGFILLLNEIWP